MKSMSVGALAIACVGLSAMGCGGTDIRQAGHDPEAIEMAGALGNRFVRAGEGNEIVARLHISALEVHGAHRPPINLALVVDTSGSMEGAPIADARAATNALLSQLAPGDRLAVIAFHSRTEVLFPSTQLDGNNLDALHAQIDRMIAQGTTDLRGGLTAGLEEYQAPRQDPLGDEADPRARAADILEAHLIANRLSRRFAQLFGHALRRHPRGEATGLEDQDFALIREAPIEERARHARGIARPRRRLEHQVLPRGEELAEARQERINR